MIKALVLLFLFAGVAFAVDLPSQARVPGLYSTGPVEVPPGKTMAMLVFNFAGYANQNALLSYQLSALENGEWTIIKAPTGKARGGARTYPDGTPRQVGREFISIRPGVTHVQAEMVLEGSSATFGVGVEFPR